MGEVANPLFPAGSHQQVMSPTLGHGYRTTGAVALSVSAGGADTDRSQTMFGIGAPFGLDLGSSPSVLVGAQSGTQWLWHGRVGMQRTTPMRRKKPSGEPDPQLAKQKTPGGSLGQSRVPLTLGASSSSHLAVNTLAKLLHVSDSLDHPLPNSGKNDCASVVPRPRGPRFGMEMSHACSDQGSAR